MGFIGNLFNRTADLEPKRETPEPGLIVSPDVVAEIDNAAAMALEPIADITGGAVQFHGLSGSRYIEPRAGREAGG